MVDANRERMRKEKANHDVNRQVEYKYPRESRSTKKYIIPLNLMDAYIKSPDKTNFLLEYSKCEVIG